MGIFFATSPLTHLWLQQFFGIAFCIGFGTGSLLGEMWLRRDSGLEAELILNLDRTIGLRPTRTSILFCKPSSDPRRTCEITRGSFGSRMPNKDARKSSFPMANQNGKPNLRATSNLTCFGVKQWPRIPIRREAIHRYTSFLNANEKRGASRRLTETFDRQKSKCENPPFRSATTLSRTRKRRYSTARRAHGSGTSERMSEQLYWMIGRNSSAGIPPLREHSCFYTSSSWDQLSNAALGLLQTGTPYELRLQMLHADGTQRWVIGRGEAVRDDGGHIRQFRGTVENANESRRRIAKRDSQLPKPKTAQTIRDLLIQAHAEENSRVASELGDNISQSYHCWRRAPFQCLPLSNDLEIGGSLELVGRRGATMLCILFVDCGSIGSNGRFQRCDDSQAYPKRHPLRCATFDRSWLEPDN